MGSNSKIPVSGLHTKRAGDVTGGNLVAYRPEGEFRLGLAVTGPQRGVLLLPGDRPEFIATSHHCLDLGKAVFHWDGSLGSISDGGTVGRPVFGSLAVRPVAQAGAPGRVVIIGRATGQNLSWDIESGNLVVNLDVTVAVLISRWTVGVNDAQGRFHALLEFPPRATAPGS